MNMLSKIIFGILILFLMSGCIHRPPSPLEQQKKEIEKLNKERGGIGLPYNYEGPNRNPSQTVTSEE